MFRKAREHYLNPLHIYCRLCDMGIAKDKAKKFSLLLTWEIKVRVAGFFLFICFPAMFVIIFIYS